MKTTYINEDMTAAYPFAEAQELPFPLSVIAEISIGYSEALLDVGESLHISSVIISADAVRVTISSNARLFGMISCVPGSQKAGVFAPETGITDIHGFMFLGVVPDSAYGNYAGRFILSPACLCPIPADVVGRYTNLRVNGSVFPVPRILKLSVYGGIALAVTDGSAYVSRTLTAPAANLAVVPSSYSYTKVESINGITGENLVISVDEDSADTVELGFHEKTLAGSLVDLGQGDSREAPAEEVPAGDLIIGTVSSKAEFRSCFPKPEESEA